MDTYGRCQSHQTVRDWNLRRCPPAKQAQMQMPANPVHLKRSPTTCLEHLTAYYCSAPNLGLCPMWLVDVTVIVIPNGEQHPLIYKLQQAIQHQVVTSLWLPRISLPGVVDVPWCRR